MAKVKIQGHASGTGVLTVTAPNTSTDRTITLPDSTDTLAVNSDVTNKLPLAGGNLTGNLGIGETSPATSIHITSATPKIRLEHTNDNGYAEIYTSAQSAIVLDADPGNTDNGTPIVFKTDGTERMRVLDSGGLTFNGDTAAANALDDYEEGVHVVTATDSGGGATYGLNASYNTFAYTKIGRLVTITGALVNSTVTGTPSGSIALSLPFACVNTTDQAGKSGGAGISYYQVQKYTSGVYPAHSIAEGASVVTLKYGVVDANQYDTKFNTSSQLYCNFSYFTA